MPEGGALASESMRGLRVTSLAREPRAITGLAVHQAGCSGRWAQIEQAHMSWGPAAQYTRVGLTKRVAIVPPDMRMGHSTRLMQFLLWGCVPCSGG